ncbi:brain tumor protein-like [Ostrea edulis]|uniref:brain tumor protein-like n=1 Tax=Ostrea edulis TaxID=37623 RepID=UPI0024AF1FDA|nr:brain tumor protein-like [Ostrea edulis]
MIATIAGEVNPLYSVACVGVDEAWVSGKDKTIRRVDIHGSVRDTVTCQVSPNDITITSQGELVYSDGPNRTVNIVRHGRTETLITIPKGWSPMGLCCTRSGDILVSMSTSGFTSRYKIVRYDKHIMKQEIERDDHGQPIYKGGRNILWVVENNNGDICASDNNAKAVVVVDKSGRVRFRYDGTPARKKTFNPEHLVINSISQIIVTDNNNACLHILDQNGQFLRCVENCGLDEPCGLSVDSEGRLWVGLLNTGKVKVIQYMK